jgi:hypothetical protein
MSSNRRNERAGDAKRAAIESALLAAGDRGMSASSLRQQSDHCHYQANKSSVAVRAKCLADVFSRWFHIDHKAAADAYVDAVQNRTRRRLRWSEKTSREAERCVREAGAQGVDTQTISEVVGICVESVRPMMKQMRDAGIVTATCMRGGVKRYFAPEHKPAIQERRKHRAHAAPTRDRVLAFINKAGAAGINTAQLVAATGLSVISVNAATNRLCRDGSAKWAHDPRTAAAGRAGTGVPRSTSSSPADCRQDLVVGGEAPKKSSKGAWLDSDPIIPAGVRVTRAPAPLPRFYVDAPERSCAARLDFIGHDTWAVARERPRVLPDGREGGVMTLGAWREAFGAFMYHDNARAQLMEPPHRRRRRCGCGGAGDGVEIPSSRHRPTPMPGR